MSSNPAIDIQNQYKQAMAIAETARENMQRHALELALQLEEALSWIEASDSNGVAQAARTFRTKITAERNSFTALVQKA